MLGERHDRRHLTATHLELLTQAHASEIFGDPDPEQTLGVAFARPYIYMWPASPCGREQLPRSELPMQAQFVRWNGLISGAGRCLLGCAWLL